MKGVHGLLLPAGLLLACATPPPGDVAATGAAAAEAPATATAELENAFWACDYIATTRGVLATPAAACRHATESLKHEKFGGSHRAMLEWWRANKVARHREMQHRLD